MIFLRVCWSGWLSPVSWAVRMIFFVIGWPGVVVGSFKRLFPAGLIRVSTDG
jgi:hypothetical protein